MYHRRRLKLRSRTGCDRCRTRHQKCDELQPQCSRCLEASSTCTYERQEKRPRHIGCPPAEMMLLSPVGHAMRLFPFLNSSHGVFLSYYAREASAAISCNESIQHDTCSAIISVGSTFPSLLYAGLLFSALHKASRTHDEYVSTKGQSIQTQVLELRSAALSLLRSHVCQDVTSNSGVIIATSLMLATCELRYDPKSSAWRPHFECARHLLSQSRAHDRTGNAVLWRFIVRRFTMIEFLVSLPTSCTQLSRRYLSPRPAALPCVRRVGVIDSTMACCEELLDVFKWIGVLEDMKSQSLGLPGSRSQYIADYTHKVATKLVSIVQQIMVRDRKYPPVVNSHLQDSRTESHLRDYRMCNTIAQHVALICLYRYYLGFGQKHPCVVSSVSSIVELAGAIDKHAGSHPSICLTTALFVAGQEAEQEREDDIKRLLEIQYQVTKSQNTRNTIDMLQSIWSAAPSLCSAREKGESSAGTSKSVFRLYVLPYKIGKNKKRTEVKHNTETEEKKSQIANPHLQVLSLKTSYLTKLRTAQVQSCLFLFGHRPQG